MSEESKWPELESNPDVMNKLLVSHGVSTKWKIFDILSLEEEYLDTISQSVLGVILLFPYTKIYKNYRAQLMEQLEKSQQEEYPDVFFMHQTVKNACATIAIIHAIANNTEHLDFTPESIVLKFISKTINLDPKEKAEVFENDVGLKKAHELASVGLNSSEVSSQDSASSQEEEDRPRTKKLDNHYLTLVNVNSKLFELDGYKDIPVYHGLTSKQTFLKDAAKICQEYMKRDPDSFNFCILAIGESKLAET